MNQRYLLTLVGTLQGPNSCYVLFYFRMQQAKYKYRPVRYLPLPGLNPLIYCLLVAPAKDYWELSIESKKPWVLWRGFRLAISTNVFAVKCKTHTHGKCSHLYTSMYICKIYIKKLMYKKCFIQRIIDGWILLIYAYYLCGFYV